MISEICVAICRGDLLLLLPLFLLLLLKDTYPPLQCIEQNVFALTTSS